jgi:hypothetical protein
MEIIPIEFFGVAIDVPFAAPLGYQHARIEDFGMKLCDPAQGIGLRFDQIRLRRTDELFNYELSAHFFGDNGTLTRTADRVKLQVRNARTPADWKVIINMLTRFYGLLNIAPTTLTILSTHVHAKFPSAEERDGYLGHFAQGLELSRPAALGYVRIVEWEKDIRVMVEQSNVVQNGIFTAWDTQFPNLQDWETFLPTIPTMMENSANVFGLSFEPLLGL